MQTQYLPETDPSVLERFEVRGPRAVRQVLEDLRGEQALLTVHCVRDHDEYAISRVLSLEDRHLDLELNTDAFRRQTLTAPGRVIVVAFLDRIKVQFEVDARVVEPEVHDHVAVLRCALPELVHRIQRREAYRVRPPLRHPVECVVRAADNGAPLVYRVLDISAGGIALAIPGDSDLPTIGEVWRHCRLEIPGHAPIPCDLEIRTLGDGFLHDGSTVRAGCAFHHPVPETERAVQRYVMDVERGRAGPGKRPEIRPACS